jgi:hypothetical protein
MKERKSKKKLVLSEKKNKETYKSCNIMEVVEIV